MTARTRCETPKSPPGDYKAIVQLVVYGVTLVMLCVKHLNPRQGITTAFGGWGALAQFHLRVKHLNPRQGITTRWCG